MEQSETVQKDEEETPGSDSDWENRILCSDGNCIGVIGPDGRCKECGKPYEGDLPLRSPEQGEKSDVPAVSQPVTESAPAADSAAEVQSELEVKTACETVGDAGADDDWGNRILCSDGNCIGVIGPDGRCKECGKPYDAGTEPGAEN
jgi:hypothetical protein